MKPIRPDCMVFYSANSCLCYDSQYSLHQIDTRLTENSGTVDITRIAELQAEFDGAQVARKRLALIVVPNAWLSISEHTLDHVVPKQLAPLAALAFAVESTFSSPENLWYRHQLKRHGKTSTMQVMACAMSLADQLCKPFTERGLSCCLVSFQQWQFFEGKTFALTRLSRQGLRSFNPAADKQNHFRHMWLGFLTASVLLQLGFMIHDYRLHQELNVLNQQYARAFSEESAASDAHFLLTVLSHVQALPSTVRISSFESDDHSAHVELSLPDAKIQPLLKRWHQEEPNWALAVDKKGQHHTVLGHDEEVAADVAVSISAM